MGKLNFSSIVELLAWFSIIIIFFVFSYEFDQEIEIYIFGASGWPRAILLLLLLTTMGNFYHLYKNGSEVQKGRVGISDNEEKIKYDNIKDLLKSGLVLLLPFIFALLLKPVGFYSATPFFIVFLIILLGEKKLSNIIFTTILIYFILICLFMVILKAPLPQGNVSPFYDFSGFLLKLNTQFHTFISK